jgi:hypothetical protein
MRQCAPLRDDTHQTCRICTPSKRERRLRSKSISNSKCIVEARTPFFKHVYHRNQSILFAISQRLRRWIPEATPQDIDTFIANMRAPGIPDPIRCATLLLKLNGMSTTRRMHGQPAPCKCCCSYAGDDIAHMIHCAAVLSFEARLFAPLSLHVIRRDGFSAPVLRGGHT